MNTNEKSFNTMLASMRDGISQWLSDNFISLVYFPESSTLEDTNAYYFLLIVKMDPDTFDINFWINYHNYIESTWEKYWMENFEIEKVPILSVNIRSMDDVEKNSFNIYTRDDTYNLIYDNQEFFKNSFENYNHSQKNILKQPDMIWI